LVARFVRDEEVPGSSPGSPTICSRVDSTALRCERLVTSSVRFRAGEPDDDIEDDLGS
jgi:hypothetical protein